MYFTGNLKIIIFIQILVIQSTMIDYLAIAFLLIKLEKVTKKNLGRLFMDQKQLLFQLIQKTDGLKILILQTLIIPE